MEWNGEINEEADIGIYRSHLHIQEGGIRMVGYWLLQARDKERHKFSLHPNTTLPCVA